LILYFTSILIFLLRWNEFLQFALKMKNLPKEAKLNINIVGVFRAVSTRLKSKLKMKKGCDQDIILSWCNKQIFDHRSILCTGDFLIKTWPMMHNEDISFETYNATTEANDHSEKRKAAAELYFQMDSYMHPVVFPNGGLEVEDENAESLVSGSSDWTKVMEIMQANTLIEFDDESKEILRKYRDTFKHQENTLPKVLQSIDFSDMKDVVRLHQLISDWPPVSVEVALELLNERYVDQKVRSLAVETLKNLSNQKLLTLLLQLTQALKFEPYHDSALARFLITRALQSKRIGHFLFWYLRSEIENSHVSRRYSILLEAYLRGCGEKMLEEFSKQTTAINILKNFSTMVNMKISKSSNSAKLNDWLRHNLQKFTLPSTFQAPYDPRVIFGKLIVEKVRVMDSKKRPVWLEFENGDLNSNQLEGTPSIKILFKQGDDLRQDMLTLQMLNLMEQLWSQECLDLHLLPYGCMSTGLQMGVIEIVPNATTVAKIQKEGGGLIRGAFKDEVLTKWLEKKNTDGDKMKKAIKTFTNSCAGYCVATYVLGKFVRHASVSTSESL